MRNQPVYWYEGMFLRPQHFQAAERYWNEMIEISEQIDHPYYYGLRSASISKTAIANNQFQVTQLQARMKDGTIVHLEAGQDPDRLDLKDSLTGKTLDAINLAEAFEKEAKVRVFLAMPRLMLGRKNAGSKEGATDARYGIGLQSVQDENEGGNDQELEFRSLNYRLMLSGQNLTGYEVLPIGQVKRSGGASSAPELDTEYIPPLIAIESWPPLSRDIIRAIYDRIGECIGVLAERIDDLDIALSASEPQDLKRALGLLRLNEAYAVLGTQTFSSGVHPYAAYSELCRIVGQLSIFGETRRTPEFPRYDHDNLWYVFNWLKEQIEKLLERIAKREDYEQRYFTGSGPGLQVALEPHWSAEGWNWYIGVNRGSLNEAEVRSLLKPGPANLDWKFGSADKVDFYKQNFHRGVPLEEVTTVPRILPAKGPWVYYAVKRDNEAWPHVQREQTLAMRLNTHLIRNLDSLAGKRELVVSVKGHNIILQFALFAVKPSR
jgi:type VI secretion system protein ImpJ